MKVGIFGGTFNPIHFGHLRAAEEVRYMQGLEKVIFLPAGIPPLKTSDLEEAAHRYAMTGLATAGNHRFAVSDIETRASGKCYTVNTLEEIRRIYPHDQLVFILGVDAFLDIPHWWQPEQLISMTDFIIVTRPGYETSSILTSPYLAATAEDRKTLQDALPRDGEPTPHNADLRASALELTSGRKAVVVPVSPLAISSTAIRTLVMAGHSIKYLLPDAVDDYIHAHELYTQ
ncbi:MAG TPA: nicotinate-nucleotide adenylyltransferase [Dissulfurispiraceae bacterium]|nr:nicotinate-nucleotide adenylyltransferase [Dissulfurispiraceae bacterium]